MSAEPRGRRRRSRLLLVLATLLSACHGPLHDRTQVPHAPPVEPPPPAPKSSDGLASFAELVALQPGLLARVVQVATDDPRPAELVNGAPRCAWGTDAPIARTIRVAKLDGRPVVGARVTLYTPPATLHGMLLTDDDGIARLDVAPEQLVRVEMDGCVPVDDAVRVIDERGPPLVLEPGRSVLRGVVVRDDDSPSVGSRVRVTTTGQTFTAWTDSRGRFELLARRRVDLPSELAFEVEAVGACFLAQSTAVPVGPVPDGRVVQLRVHRWARLRVEIEGLDDSMLGRADLRVSWDPRRAEGSTFPFESARTSEAARDGAALVLPRVPPLVPLSLEVACDGRTILARCLDRLVAGEETLVVLVTR